MIHTTSTIANSGHHLDTATHVSVEGNVDAAPANDPMDERSSDCGESRNTHHADWKSLTGSGVPTGGLPPTGGGERLVENATPEQRFERLLFLLTSEPFQESARQAGLRIEIQQGGAFGYHETRLRIYSSVGLSTLHIPLLKEDIVFRAQEDGRLFEIRGLKGRLIDPSYMNQWRGCVMSVEDIADVLSRYVGSPGCKSEMLYVANSRLDGRDGRRDLLDQGIRCVVSRFWKVGDRRGSWDIQAQLGDFSEENGMYIAHVSVSRYLDLTFGLRFRYRSQSFRIEVGDDLLVRVSGSGLAETQIFSSGDLDEWWSLDVMEHLGRTGATLARALQNYLHLTHRQGLSPEQQAEELFRRLRRNRDGKEE